MARHLHLLGHTAHIFYPRRTDKQLYKDLVHQVGAELPWRDH